MKNGFLNRAELDCSQDGGSGVRKFSPPFADGDFIKGKSGMLYAVCCIHRYAQNNNILCIVNTRMEEQVCCVGNHNEQRARGCEIIASFLLSRSFSQFVSMIIQ